MKILNFIFILCFLICVGGCAQVTTTAKNAWSSSVRTIKKAPGATVSAIKKTPGAIRQSPAYIKETAKTIWGSSTRALENARVDAISKTYQCSLNDCFDAVLSLSRDLHIDVNAVKDEDVDEDVDEETPVVFNDDFFDVFIKNRDKQHIVVMGISGNVDTTEAGIFFSQPSLTTVKLEVTSLSSSAKRRVAQAVFDALDLRFSESN